jgi:uncharacterized protein
MERSRARWTGSGELVAFLGDARVYPDRPGRVEVIETHKSWVFLTDTHAYKLKKPIRYNSVDFRPLAARCADCETEVVLNRRLAGDVYLGVEQIRRDDDGALSIGGPGTLVDCLVTMQRLPAERMLSHLITTGRVRNDEIRPVAAKLARFYRDGPSVLADPEEYCLHLQSEMQLSVEALTLPDRGLDPAEIMRLHDGQRRFLAEHGDLLRGRVMAGRIVDGHGDLRAEHVCVLPDPVIFDCLEFDARLRRVDPIDELSFLALECERLGDPSLGQVIFAVYQEVTGDEVSPALLAFYTVYRACMWARLAIWRTLELDPDGWSKWVDRARTYVWLAEARYAAMARSGSEEAQR